MLSLAGILLSLGLLIALAYRGISVIVLGPLAALLAAAFATGTPLLATYTQQYMPALGQFIVAYFPLFLLGAIFGRLMDDSGFARAIADTIIRWIGPQQGILATVLACAVLTYGGVSLFVVAFAIYPVASALFRAGNIPKRLLPASIALGSFTFTMTALPGTPAIQNAIPMPYFGTTSFAAPGLGLMAAIIMFGGGQLCLSLAARRAAKAGEGYSAENPIPASTPEPTTLRDKAHGGGYDLNELSPDKNRALVPFALAITPILLVIALNYLFSAHILAGQDTSYLGEARFGATTIDAVRGVWSIILSLSIAIGFILLTGRCIKAPSRSVFEGATAAVLPIFNTASLVGFGAVVASLPGFMMVQTALAEAGGGPLVSLAITTAVLAGLTGSASGGMTIALEAVGAEYKALADSAGIDPGVMHRITSLATGSLDALPHNGAVITLLSICGRGHRQAYGSIFMVAVAIPLLALMAALIVASF